MWHVPPQIPPSHNKSEEDGASLSFHLLAAQKAAAAAIITLILILPLLNYASLNLILLIFFFLLVLLEASVWADTEEELRHQRGAQRRADAGQLRRFCLCQACPARRRPRGRAGRRPKVSSSLPALERGHVLLEATLAGERMVGPSLGSLGRRTRAEND